MSDEIAQRLGLPQFECKLCGERRFLDGMGYDDLMGACCYCAGRLHNLYERKHRGEWFIREHATDADLAWWGDTRDPPPRAAAKGKAKIKTALRLKDGFRVGGISRAEAIRMVVAKHYLHRPAPLTHAFGLYRAEQAVGVICFGSPASHDLMKGACPTQPEAVIELNRLWVDDAVPRNGESWLIARAFALLPPLIVVSYADTAQGHAGIVYRAAGFYYAGWTDMDRRTPRFDYVPPERTVATLFGDVTTQPHSREAFRSGFAEKRRREPKVRYWKASGDRRQRFHLEKLCAWPKLSWKDQPPPMGAQP